MLGKVESEELRKLIRRFCAPRSDGSVPEGYFRIDGGRTVKAARTVAASVHWKPDIHALEDELFEVLEDALQEHLYVWVRAIPKGERHPAKTYRMDGNPELAELEDEDTKGPKGPHADKEALALVALGQMRMINSLQDRVDAVREEKERFMVETGIMRYAAQQPAIGQDPMMRQAMEMIAPSVPRLFDNLPQILAILANWQAGKEVEVPAAPAPAPGDAAPPEDPADLVGFHVDAIFAAVQGIAVVGAQHQGDEELAARSRPHFNRLAQLVEQVAGFVGLQVVRTPPPPSSPPPADAAQGAA